MKFTEAFEMVLTSNGLKVMRLEHWKELTFVGIMSIAEYQDGREFVFMHRDGYGIRRWTANGENLLSDKWMVQDLPELEDVEVKL